MNDGVTGLQRWVSRVLAAAVIVAGGAILLHGPYRQLLGAATGSPAVEPREAPCLPGTAIEIMDSPHISPAAAGSVEHNSVPPTSGPHYAFTISPGSYEEPVPEGLIVHALEHGHIAIQYAPGTPDREVAGLRRIAKRYGNDVVLAPYPPLPQGIALTAWGRLRVLSDYDEAAITEFIERLRGRYNHGWTRSQDCVCAGDQVR